MLYLHSNIRLNAAVQQLTTGCTSGIDGLPAEFYNHSFQNLAQKLLSLLPKKGDFGLLKYWRPVSILYTNYTILSKYSSNRLKELIDTLIHVYQSYCIQDHPILDNLFLTRDAIELSGTDAQDLGFL